MSYSAKYMDHFTNPRGVGELEPHDAISEVEHSGGGCFDRVKLTLQFANDQISYAMFRARACSGTIAACSALTELVTEMDVAAAQNLTTEDLINYLDGVPEKKIHSVELAIHALHEALSSLKK